MRTHLIEIRKNKKLTQKQISDLIGISRTTYNAYELGIINIPIDKALKIKEVLKYKKDDIFFNDNCQ